MSFKVERDDDLSQFENAVARTACRSSGSAGATASGRASRSGSRPRAATPWNWCSDVRKLGSSLPRVNPRPFLFRPGGDGGLPGIAPPRMDHVLVTAE